MINLKTNIEKRLISLFIYAVTVFLISIIILMVMPKNIQYIDDGRKIKLPEGIHFVRSKSSSRISPSVDFKIGDIQYYSICSYLTDDKAQLCYEDYEGINFVGSNVFFLEIEKFSKKEHQYIGGIILQGKFYSEKMYIGLNTNTQLIEKIILFRKYFDFSVRFALFLSLMLIFITLIFWVNKKYKS
ncbi:MULTISPECIES: hypothetical protein [unclassified Neisseria]|uniref:hypothetical protein n=1 Tax=unclassified Neisseria TaxID=2623750 RepID=UPI001071907E|nr:MULTISPECIES: hypothetical protein [unclassified Neisseria]MBF0804234.1 hypothetical protein [Neisseria sp. 19428wB4_WF04]TFU43026.1 hypothetical protein E4T99_07710 [Neisseria sp. WF04]